MNTQLRFIVTAALLHAADVWNSSKMIHSLLYAKEYPITQKEVEAALADLMALHQVRCGRVRHELTYALCERALGSTCASKTRLAVSPVDYEIGELGATRHYHVARALYEMAAGSLIGAEAHLNRLVQERVMFTPREVEVVLRVATSTHMRARLGSALAALCDEHYIDTGSLYIIDQAAQDLHEACKYNDAERLPEPLRQLFTGIEAVAFLQLIRLLSACGGDFMHYRNAVKLAVHCAPSRLPSRIASALGLTDSAVVAIQSQFDYSLARAVSGVVPFAATERSVVVAVLVQALHESGPDIGLIARKIRMTRQAVSRWITIYGLSFIGTATSSLSDTHVDGAHQNTAT